MFLFSSQYQDVATLSNLPRFTGGQTWFYPGWNAARSEDARKFATEFSEYLSTEIGLEAVLRVRATTGLRMNAFYGNFFNRSSDLCAFPAFPRDQCFIVEVSIDENIVKPHVASETRLRVNICIMLILIVPANCGSSHHMQWRAEDTSTNPRPTNHRGSCFSLCFCRSTSYNDVLQPQSGRKSTGQQSRVGSRCPTV